ILVTHLFQLFKRRYNRFYGNDESILMKNIIN
ncbi:hypothetical protein, partial [Staphylococcus aureus]